MKEENKRYRKRIDYPRKDDFYFDLLALKADWEKIGKDISNTLEKPIEFPPYPRCRSKMLDAYQYLGSGMRIKDPTVAIVNIEQILAETSPLKRNKWQQIGLFFNNLYCRIKRRFSNKKPINMMAITDKYQVFHQDDYPILYTGVNYLDDRIIGSFVEELEENRIKYFQSIICEKQYDLFLKKEITYLDLLKSGFSIVSAVEKDIEGVILSTKYISFSEIEPSELPSKNSFCPTLITQK